MKNIEKLKKNFTNKKILITGHTGFKGTWLTMIFILLGARVYGISKNYPTKFYKNLRLRNVKNYIFDLKDVNKTKKTLNTIKPDFIFHLAAQAIVSKSYTNPIETWNSNLISFLNILESLRNFKKKVNVVMITSDKCYLNVEKKEGYKENERLGGFENYSASKASCEILFNSYFHSYFKKLKFVKIVSARAGNVIGGGDFKINRIIPDFFRSIFKKKKLLIRNPFATRPWQHVLEPLSGYLILGEKILNNKLSNNLYPSWNFGPYKKNCKKVKEVIDFFYKELGIKKNYKIKKNLRLKEAQLLSLNISKAKKELNWEPRLSLNECIELTTDWYINYMSGEPLERITEEQIEYYENR